MSVERAFDELRFGPQRTLNLRDGLPSAKKLALPPEMVHLISRLALASLNPNT